MFDWALFKGLETYLKYLTEAGIWLPISALLCISHMCLTFLTLFMVAAFWMVQYLDHITVTIRLIGLPFSFLFPLPLMTTSHLHLYSTFLTYSVIITLCKP